MADVMVVYGPPITHLPPPAVGASPDAAIHDFKGSCRRSVRITVGRSLHCVERGSDGSQKRYQQNGASPPPFLYAWVSQNDCALDLRGHQSRPRPTAIPPALECRSATRFTPRLRCESIGRRRSATANSTLTCRTCAECPPRGCPYIVYLVAS